MISFKIRKVLIFTKRSAYQAYFQEYQGKPMRKLLRSGDKGLLHIRKTHSAHYDTLRHVKKALTAQGVSYEVRFRGQKFHADRYDLVVAVGGDGTFLEACHRIRHTPILSVNSDKNHSVGKFSVTDRDGFEACLRRLLLGDYTVEKLNRLRAELNGEAISYLALNEILVCHASPAAMSHYVLKIGRVSERQRSSGVWIATASGSTAAIRSAGGRMISKLSKAIQYLPRELFDGHGIGYRLKGGILSPGASISVVSQMQEGMIYLDGSHHASRFRYGQELKIGRGEALQIVRFSS